VNFQRNLSFASMAHGETTDEAVATVTKKFFCSGHAEQFSTLRRRQ